MRRERLSQRRACAAVASAMSVVVLSCASRQPAGVDLAHATAGLGPYRAENRLEQYRAIDAAAQRALKTGRGASKHVVGEAKLSDGRGRIQVANTGGKGPPDRFFMLAAGGADPQDFGFLFELSGTGHFDWLVLNGGLAPDRASTMVWTNYHLIDTNGDGRVDVMVFNDVDLDGDHYLDPGVTLWLYDRDFDGRVDEGEYLGPFGSRPVERRGDDLIVAVGAGEQHFSTRDASVLTSWSDLMERINEAAATSRK